MCVVCVCVCVCVLQCLNYLTLRSCLFKVCLIVLFVLQFALHSCLFYSLPTALFASRKIDDWFLQNLSMNMVISFIV